MITDHTHTQLATVSQRLKFIRTVLLHLTQIEMAALLGISHSTYSKLESGAIIVSSKMTSRLVKLLGVESVWLKDGNGKCPQSLSIPAIRKRTTKMVCDEFGPSDAAIEEIIRLAQDGQLRMLAKEIAATAHVNFEKALTALVYDKVKDHD